MDKRKWTEEEIADYRKTHGLLLYYNKKDANFLIPKAYGFGRTVNWANPISWIFASILVGLIVLSKIR